MRSKKMRKGYSQLRVTSTSHLPDGTISTESDLRNERTNSVLGTARQAVRTLKESIYNHDEFASFTETILEGLPLRMNWKKNMAER